MQTVAEAMLTRPTLHGSSATVGELRAFFRDDHVHMALLVDGARLVAAVERADLARELTDAMPARRVARLAGRAVSADALLADVLESMRSHGRRRVAVTGADGALLGLLCLKATGLGFCSDGDVAERKRSSL
jgi:CBS domain-containing protein